MASALPIADAGVGVLLLAAAAAAHARRPTSRVGALFGVAGAMWLIGAAFRPALYVHRGALVHLHLAYPTGRLRSWTARGCVGLTYATAAVEPWASNDPLTIAVAALAGATAAATFAPTLGRTRRAMLPALGTALAYSSMLAFAALGRLLGLGLRTGVSWAYDVVIVAIAAVLLFDLVRGRWADALVAGLVVDLGAQQGPQGLRGALGRALGDRSLELGYWSPPTGGYVDEAGRVVELHDLPPGRAVTAIDDADGPLAVLVHDSAALDDVAYVDSVAAAARLAVSSTRLQAATDDRIVELAASRRRIVAAADTQRQRIARELDDGPEARLCVAGGHLLQAAARCRGDDTALRARIEALSRELEATRRELSDFARGVHPRALVDGGVAAALPDLISRAVIPVTVHVTVGRLPPAVEAAIYFVVAEALTNTAKHSGASNVTVTVGRDPRAVHADITDDGVGGADPTRGSGLRGLADRVAALGGALSVHSPAGRGTRIEVILPLDAAE